METKRLRVTLIKSVIGRKPSHRRTVVALGLRKISSSVVHEASPAILGMVNKVSYLVKVEETE